MSRIDQAIDHLRRALKEAEGDTAVDWFIVCRIKDALTALEEHQRQTAELVRILNRMDPYAGENTEDGP